MGFSRCPTRPVIDNPTSDPAAQHGQLLPTHKTSLSLEVSHRADTNPKARGPCRFCKATSLPESGSAHFSNTCMSLVLRLRSPVTRERSHMWLMKSSLRRS